jgi:uncharacterized protein (TIGR02145 family)
MKTLKSFLIIAMTLHGMSPIKAQTPGRETVTDIDGNVYRTVIIGNFLWMAENLKTTSCNDGTKIPNVADSIAWTGLTSGAYCWYRNDESNAKTYGALYNWYAVNTGRLCPRGWRVPTDKEWKDLEGNADTRFSQGDPAWDKKGGRGQDAGRRLKAASGWSSGGSGTDNVGFSALPGGERCSSGRFFVAGRSGFWWSCSANNDADAWYRNMIYGLDDIFRNIHPKWMGFSVRCLRDKQGQ